MAMHDHPVPRRPRRATYRAVISSHPNATRWSTATRLAQLRKIARRRRAFSPSPNSRGTVLNVVSGMVSYPSAAVRGVDVRPVWGAAAEEPRRGPRPDERRDDSAEVSDRVQRRVVPDHTPDDLRNKAEASQTVLEEMKAAGVFVFADGGIDASTAVCSVVSRDGRPVFTDGPYVETKEHLGGFTVVDVPDDEAARYWAGRLAVSLDWPQEVHRFPSGVVEIIERQSQESE